VPHQNLRCFGATSQTWKYPKDHYLICVTQLRKANKICSAKIDYCHFYLPVIIDALCVNAEVGLRIIALPIWFDQSFEPQNATDFVGYHLCCLRTWKMDTRPFWIGAVSTMISLMDSIEDNFCRQPSIAPPIRSLSLNRSKDRAQAIPYNNPLWTRASWTLVWFWPEPRPCQLQFRFPGQIKPMGCLTWYGLAFPPTSWRFTSSCTSGYT